MFLRKRRSLWYTSLFCQIPNKSILSITYSFYLNTTMEKGEIIVILSIVEVLRQSPLFGYLTECFGSVIII